MLYVDGSIGAMYEADAVGELFVEGMQADVEGFSPGHDYGCGYGSEVAGVFDSARFAMSTATMQPAGPAPQSGAGAGTAGQGIGDFWDTFGNVAKMGLEAYQNNQARKYVARGGNLRDWRQYTNGYAPPIISKGTGSGSGGQVVRTMGGGSAVSSAMPLVIGCGLIALLVMRK